MISSLQLRRITVGVQTWLLLLGAFAAAPAHAQTVLNENFDFVAAIFVQDNPWHQFNRSSPTGPGVWRQGATGISAHIGAANACISNDFSACNGFGTISSWLITPVVTLQNGQTFQFYTRTRSFVSAPDRLQVRMSLSSANPPDVGLTATSVGTFTTLLLDINPTYSTTGYPTTWTAFTIVLSGIAAPTQGRLAFRYFVEDGGTSGLNSDVVVIDTVTLTNETTNPCDNPLPVCNGDVAPIGGDGVVNVTDLLAVIGNWGQSGPPRPQGDAAPLPNGDCMVNVSDLLAVIGGWGACPGPLGACCLPNGECTNGQTSTSCAVLNGVYQGNNSTCAQVNCPQPDNDICESATPIAIGGSASEDLATASTDFSPTCNGIIPGIGRWHSVVGNGTNLTASLCDSTGSFNGRLTVYCGPTCTRLLCVGASDNNACGNKDTITWCAADGQTYWVLVHAVSVNPGQGSYTLNITSRGTCNNALPCGPENDDCEDAIPISNGLTPFSTIGATTDGLPVAPGQCNDSDETQTAADIWFLYTATCTGTLRVTTCAQLGGSTDYDSDIVIYLAGVGCPPPDSARIGCNDDDPINPCGQEPPFASTAFAQVVSGQQYLIRVGGFSDKKIDFGEGVLNITCTP